MVPEEQRAFADPELRRAARDPQRALRAQGTSNGGAFLVAARGARYRMTVDPLTGRVRIDRQ